MSADDRSLLPEAKDDPTITKLKEELKKLQQDLATYRSRLVERVKALGEETVKLAELDQYSGNDDIANALVDMIKEFRYEVKVLHLLPTPIFLLFSWHDPVAT